MTGFHPLTCVTFWNTLVISLFIRVHQKFCFRSWYILLLPGWIENFDRCALSRICFQSSWFFGTTKQLSNHKIPLWSCRKHLYLLSPCASFCLMMLMLLSWACAIMTWSWRVGSMEMWFRVPWGMISKLSFLISLQRVSLYDSTDKQWKWAFTSQCVRYYICPARMIVHLKVIVLD